MKKVREWLPDWTAKVTKEPLLHPLMVDMLEYEADSTKEALFIVYVRMASIYGWLATFKPEHPRD